MFEHMENMQLDGVPIQSTSSWTPYSPTPMKLKDEQWDIKVPPAKELIGWYNEKMFGYPGLTKKKYLSADLELLKEELSTGFICKEEFSYMNSLYNLVKFISQGEDQCTFQIPEDFLLNFKDLDFPVASNLTDCYDKIMHGHTWSHSKLSIVAIGSITDVEPKEMVIHNFKLACLFFLHHMAYAGHTVFTEDMLYRAYRTCYKHYWGNILDNTKPDTTLVPEVAVTDDFMVTTNFGWYRLTRQGFLPDGLTYTRVDHFVPIKNLLYYTEEELGV